MTFTWPVTARVYETTCRWSSLFNSSGLGYDTFFSLLDPGGHCVANEQYIGQLKETFATSVPSRIAAFFGEPIQVQYSAAWEKVVIRKPYRCSNKWHWVCLCVGFVSFSQGVGGAVQYPKNYLKEAYKLVRERGGVCIADEVQMLLCILINHLTGL